MHQAEIIVLLFTVVGVLAVVAHKISLPYPIVLVLGGLALGFVPRLPTVNLNPDVVFYFILPALIYPAALFTSWRDFERNLRPILLLAIGLVLATTLAVAWIAHSIVPALPWAAAFALGAIVSPPDAVAATAIIRRLGVPHRIQVILEGESLVNDATALVALQFAIAALVTGTFSPAYAAGRFVWAAAGGIGIGLLVGVAMRWVQSHLDNPPIQITFSLLTPFIAYLPAEQVHASGVLATVASGIFLGWHSPLMITARTRLQAYAFWETIVFLLNGFVFIVIGLQLPRILHAWNRRIAYRRVYECDRHLRNSNFGPFCVGDTCDLPVSCHLKPNDMCATYSIVAARCDRRLGWHAWRRVARCRVCIAFGDAHRPDISRARLHFICRLFGDKQNVIAPGKGRPVGSAKGNANAAASDATGQALNQQLETCSHHWISWHRVVWF